MNTPTRFMLRFAILAAWTAPPAAAAEKHDYPLAPMSFEQVELRDRFWLPRLKTQKNVTVPFALEKTE